MLILILCRRNRDYSEIGDEISFVAHPAIGRPGRSAVVGSQESDVATQPERSVHGQIFLGLSADVSVFVYHPVTQTWAYVYVSTES